MALAGGEIDPASFTSLRILSGAATLWIISALLRRRSRPSGSWISAFLLALYAIAFSYAYVRLSAGTGALVLMGAVQATMIVGGILAGERLIPIQWMGLLIALGGVVYLVFPGITGPPVIASLFMAIAGLAWGIYSLRGRGSDDPITATTDNFIRAVPIAVIVTLVQLEEMRLSTQGLLRSSRLVRAEGKTPGRALGELIENYIKERDTRTYIDDLWKRIRSKLGSKDLKQRDINRVIKEARKAR